MKFDFNAKEYIIEFERNRRVPHGSVYGVERVYTTAKIFEVGSLESKFNKERKLVREYTVGYNPSDRFSYDAGRKNALALAMKDAPIEKSCGSGVPLMGEVLGKDSRTAVWKAYHGRKNV
jgi:hypothetical protein